MVVFVLMARVVVPQGVRLRRRTRRDADVARRARGDPRPRLLVESLVVLTLSWSAFSCTPAAALRAVHRRPARRRSHGCRQPGVTAEEYLEEVEWPTLVFFAGLFVMVGGLVETSASSRPSASGSPTPSATDYLAACVAARSDRRCCPAIVDNIPYVATMAPGRPTSSPPAATAMQANSLWWALALGADLGGNATAVGASANVVSSASPPATATRSRSGSSPSTG